MLKISAALFLTIAVAFVNGINIEVSEYDREIQVKNQNELKSTSNNALCKKDQHIIENQNDLYQLSNECPTIDGSISFQNYVEPHINLGNIKTINGNFILEENNEVVSIQGDALEKIGGTFKLYDLTSLNAVNFPHLHDLNVVHWRVVPILGSVAMDNNIDSIKSLVISDSSLTSLRGFDKIAKLDTFNINNNRYLESIATNVKYISKQLSVSANADELNLDMSELIWANNVTIRDTKEINLEHLQYVNQSLEFIENKVNKLELSELKSVGGTLGIIENKHLSKADFNNVSQISGGLMIAGNDALEKIGFFKSLKLIGGAIQFKGNIKDTDFPNLRLVKGSAIIQSTSDELDCSKWVTPNSGSSIIRGGKIECEPKGKKSSANVRQDGTVLDRTTTTESAEAKETNGSTIMGANFLLLALAVLGTVRILG
ncbi:uncharacterized protein KLLA0_C01001g [Kluyveromyces lactis]|uniref:KLLA0C01001p n=1 Tax=Kluyveromyces lactis (strain ATCC 8585 / CBS 2359 / DSM 70799 / NBRC 1267 / NRRL Y-1140 / WM37) TaxID=284590 RepID=Q6CV00_KLULA|nr:uncharacterized protein KLLA0_C01001g [Kluyveromyces lactis]CAH01090.1 KLLA0C01001p [Kluyveromyces lactis]|eukprot:XP_452239.1 uncharacterized protein KLLA0_C01001g [Kluyveromyces lactis]